MPADRDDTVDDPEPQREGADEPDESASAGGEARAGVPAEPSMRSYPAENPNDETEDGVAPLLGDEDEIEETYARENPTEEELARVGVQNEALARYEPENPGTEDLIPAADPTAETPVVLALGDRGGREEDVQANPISPEAHVERLEASRRDAEQRSVGERDPVSGRDRPPEGVESREAAIGRRAGELRDEAARAEREVTPDIEEVARSSFGYRAGAEWVLKSESSVVTKLDGDMRDRGLSLDEASAGINDTVRYTIVYAPDRYTGSTHAAIRELEARGYGAINVKNCWQEENPYKGINAVFVSPTGRSVELQFHTPESWDMKQATHDDYNIVKDVGADPDQRRSANDRSIAAAAGLETPPGVDGIGSPHRYRRL
jgi:hypothetical protein